MTSHIVLDTDVAVRGFRGQLSAAMAEQLTGKVWCVTAISVGELTQWGQLRSWAPHTRTALRDWLACLEIVDVSVAAARTWGSLAAAGQRRGRPAPVHNTWIAACCCVELLPLATSNPQDYSDFVAHHGLEVHTDAPDPQLALPGGPHETASARRPRTRRWFR